MTGLTMDRESRSVILSELIVLRQHMKYEHMRGDADAALAAGRWRLAVLSARGALGFAVDVVRARAGAAYRDEVHRRRGIENVFGSRTGGRVVALLTKPVTKARASVFVRSCWKVVDAMFADAKIDVPLYYSGRRMNEHRRARRAWLLAAEQLGMETLYSAEETKQILAAGGAK
jgi:hypothetical protein